jgi:hypothetical protein
MRIRWLPVVFAACSDYDLAEGNSPAGRRPGGSDTFLPDAEIGAIGDSADTSRGDTDLPGEPVPEGKIDVVLRIDIAYFYDCYHADLALNATALVDALFDSGADVAVGIATFDDYNVDGEWYTAWGGEPYTFISQLSTDRSRALAAAGRLSLEWGGDGPGTGYEALLQAAEGKAYDQDCDGKLDGGYDIAPFQSGKGDAFGGKVGGNYDSGVPGTGSEGGIGFRKNSKRVVVLVTENGLREARYGDAMPGGTCPAGANKSEAVRALTAIDARLLGVNAYEFWDIDDKPQEQLEAIASQTGSKIDKDGDGKKNELAVFGEDWNWPATAVLVSAIWQLAGA